MKIELTEEQLDRILAALSTQAQRYAKDAEDARREMEKAPTPANEYHFKKIIATADNDREETKKLWGCLNEVYKQH